MREFEFVLGVDELGRQIMSGIPEDVWQTYVKEAKIHYPDAGEDAPFRLIADLIVSTISHEVYVLTGIPPEVSQALDTRLEAVGWNHDQFHVYLLRSAAKRDMFRLVSFGGDPQQFGTILVTGLRKSTFDNIEKVSGVSVEDFLGLLLNGIENGEMEISPDGILSKVLSNKQ